MKGENQTMTRLSTDKIPFLMCINIQSLRCHHDELKLELDNYDKKPTIIAFTETWLTENDALENDYNFETYQANEHKPRTSGQERGGVAFYVQEDINYRVVEFQCEIECLIIQTTSHANIIRNFCVIYRPHSLKIPNFLQAFEHLLEFLRNLKHDTILCGDFNIDIIKDSKEKLEYENLLLAYDFKRQNSDPTRVTPTSATCLDHISSTSYQIKTETIKTTISDHYTVLGTIPGVIMRESPKIEVKQTYRDMRKIKGENALNFLFILDQTLKKFEPSKQIDLETIAKTIMRCVNKFAPEQETTVRKVSNDWITKKLKKEITRRNKFFQKWIKCPTEENRIFYKKQRNMVTTLKKNAKRQSNFDRLGENPSAKTIYRNLKSHRRCNQPAVKLPDLEKINQFFTSIGSKLASSPPPAHHKYEIDKLQNSMVLNYTNELEVSKVVGSLKNKKSRCHDGISNEILKCCSPIIEKYFVRSFNDCIEKQVFPECLKIAKVLPLFKKGDDSQPSNYRPISLLSSLSKVFEKLLHKRMVKFFNKNNLFTPVQYGFRKTSSCAHAIAEVTDFIRGEIDKKSSGISCFIDLQKAFDSLDHGILLAKLSNYGFRGPIYNIMVDYLSNRSQYVYVNGNRSDIAKITTGVPQGSVLGPFLFLVYINDLPQILGNDNKMALFADDASIIKSEKTNCNMQNDLDKICDWFNYNKMSLNTSKCETMSFGNNYQNTLTVQNEAMPRNTCCKYLGVLIDSKLTFRDHLIYVVKKLNKFCGLIYRVRDIYPIKCLLLFYNAYAKSVICYGLLVYGRAAKTNLTKIEMAQRRIIRAILFKKKFDSLQNILHQTTLNTVFELFIQDVFREIFNQLRSNGTSKLSKLIAEWKQRKTRGSMKGLLPIPYSRTKSKSKSVEHTLIKGYNWLLQTDLMPGNIKTMTQTQVKTYLKNLNIYYR